MGLSRPTVTYSLWFNFISDENLYNILVPSYCDVTKFHKFLEVSHRTNLLTEFEKIFCKRREFAFVNKKRAYLTNLVKVRVTQTEIWPIILNLIIRL